MPELLHHLRQNWSLWGLFFLSGVAVSCTPSVTPTISPTENPGLTPAVAATITATPSPTETPTKIPVKSIYTEIRDQMRTLSKELRAQRKRANPEKWARQIEPENENIGPTLFEFGCGNDNQQDQEGKSYPVRICSNRLAIFAEKQIFFFIVTHDLGVQFPGHKGILVRPDELWLRSGNNFELVRDAIQTTYGVPVDVIGSMENSVLGHAVKDGFSNRLIINNPVAFTAQPVWIDGKKTDDKFFPEGEQELDEKGVIIYATSTPATKGRYAPILENQHRLDTLIKAFINETAKRKKTDAKGLLPLSFALSSDYMTGKIKADGPSVPMIKLFLQILTSDFSADNLEDVFGASVYLLDPNNSVDGTRGVISGNRNSDPYIKIAGYPDDYFVVPDWREICAVRPPSPEPCGANFFTDDPKTNYAYPVVQALITFAKAHSLYNTK